MRRNRLALLLAASSIAGALPLVVGAQEGAEGRPAQASAQPASTLAEGIPRSAQGVCITPEARQRVEACPSGAPAANKRAGSRVTGPGAQATSHFQQTKRREQEKREVQTAPGVQIDAATRTGRENIQVRALQLLQREVGVLERLVQRTRAGDARGADYLLRLAETYFELQQVYNTQLRSLDEPIFQAQQSKNAAKVRELQQQQAQATEQLTHFREEAIRTYARLVRDYPNYRRMDEVLFSLAFGLEEMRQFERARQVYHRLIKSYPQSRFIPHAYLSFAEFYFGEGNMSAAQQFYTKVTEIPPDRNPVYGYALYKTAWALYNLEDFRGALTQFVRTVEFANQNPDARDAANLARQSRRELVLPYSRVGRPSQALEFFRRYATNEEQAREMLEALGELYFDTGQWPETIETYHRLMAEQPQGDRLCYWQSRVTNAVISSRPKADQVTEVRRLVDVYGTFTQANHPQESMTECKQATATVLVELATAWHREAMGTDEQPGTNDRRTMQGAAALYRLVIDRFPDMESMQFPDIDRRDWPTNYRVSYFYAELLWRMEDWAQCGPAFDRVVELNPQGEFTQDAAYAAVLCYNNLYQQQYQGRERQTREEQGGSAGGRRGGGRRGGRREPSQPTATTVGSDYVPRNLNETENGMLNAFTRFVCYVADSEELPTIKYRRARIYYESNHYEEAAVLFRDIALNNRNSELAEYAANLYLDSLNILGTQWQRSQCINEIRDNIEPLSGAYCANEEQRGSHADLCRVLGQLRCDTLRLQAEAAQREGRHRDAAQINVTIAREHRECGRLDEVLYNAAINYEAARLLGRAIRVRTILIQNFPESELAKRAVYLVGANYHALAIYNQAAEWYERFARQYPGEDGSQCTAEQRSNNTCAIAQEALQNATFFRLGLGQTEEAIEDAELFERNYRRRMPRETSQVMFSIGSIYERQNNWNYVFNHYRGWLREYGRTGLPHEVIRANVQMGRSQWELDNKDEARRYFEAALQVWTRGAGEAIARAEGTDEERTLWLARAKDATSEAIFYLSEYEYAAFRQIRFPAFHGGRTAERVTRWATTDFTQWMTQKRDALLRAEASYNRIAELEIPQWQIAAAARVGEMFRSFMDQIRDAPIPEEIESDEELYAIYVGALEDAARPLQQQAMEKFEFCLITATRVRWFNNFSQQCEQELNGLDAARYPLAAELRGDATYIQRQLAEPGAVELTTDQEADLGEDSSVPGPTEGGGS